MLSYDKQLLRIPCTYAKLMSWYCVYVHNCGLFYFPGRRGWYIQCCWDCRTSQHCLSCLGRISDVSQGSLLRVRTFLYWLQGVVLYFLHGTHFVLYVSSLLLGPRMWCISIHTLWELGIRMKIMHH